jgi:hypothetical protein
LARKAKIKTIEKNMFFLKEKGHHKRAARVFLVRCAVEKLRLFVRGQRCQNKVSFDKPQPKQIK